VPDLVVDTKTVIFTVAFAESTHPTYSKKDMLKICRWPEKKFSCLYWF